jgi:outer membrane protein
MERNLLVCTGMLMMIIFTVTGIAGAAGQELDLEASVNLALENNRDVKVAEKDYAAADWRLRELKADKLPVVNLKHTDTRVKPNPSEALYQYLKYDPPETNYYNNQLTVSVPLYTGGQLEGLIKQADINRKVADLNLKKVKQQVKLEATVAYFNLLQANSLAKLNEETVNRLTNHLKNARGRFTTGVATKNDVLRSEVELANAKENLIKAQNDSDLAQANFNNIMGRPLTTAIAVKADLSYQKYDGSLAECTKRALQSRVEVLLAEQNCENAKSQVAIAKSGHFPTVSFVGTFDQNEDVFPGADNSNWSLSLICSWNFYDSGRTKFRINQATTLQDKAGELSLKAKETICLEVRQAYLSMQEADKRIHTGELALNLANDNFRLTQGRYNSGTGINLDVIDSQLALVQTKTRYINSLYDYNVSLARLQKACGD